MNADTTCAAPLAPQDLRDTSQLEAYVKRSDVTVAFLSGSIDTRLHSAVAECSRSDYFRSLSCLRELRAAETAGKPICFCLELDPRHGAVPLEIHRRDCPEDLRHLLTTHPIVPWFRAGQFQQVSLRQILQRVLTLNAGDIFIPGEILRKTSPLTPPPAPALFHLYVSTHNRGAAESASLLTAEAERVGGCQLLTTSVPEQPPR